jgi:hypothetical protein
MKEAGADRLVQQSAPYRPELSQAFDLIDFLNVDHTIRGAMGA